MDPNIITIDSDDSNDAPNIPLKNNKKSLVIVHRVVNNNNIEQINKNNHNSYISHNHETKSSNNLESQDIEIIDVENYKSSKMLPNNKQKIVNNKEIINLCSEPETTNPEYPEKRLNLQPNYKHSITWSHNTTNYMKQSVIQSNKLVLMQNPPNAHQSSFPRHQNLYKTSDMRNAVYPYSYMNNSNYFQSGYYNNGVMMNSYVPNNNFWTRVKVEEIPEGEVVAQYFYNNDTQTPVTIENHFQVTNTGSQFIDISALPNVSNKTNSLEAKSTEMDNIVSCENVNASDRDVIFVGEFKQNDQQTSESAKDTVEVNVNGKNDETKHIKKRLRKNNEAVEPRRNPKRQVQVNREFTKLIDDILWNDDLKENKVKKNVNKANKEKIEKKPIRVSPRIPPNCGAVYSPPSPLSADHIRKWPTEGMHEKPEYNPQTGKIEPFDYITRNIANSYIAKNPPKSKATNKQEKNNKKTESINVLSHEMLHHMISYVATVMKMKKCSSESLKETNKVDFLKDLGLTENEEKEEKEEENCDNVKDMFKNIIHAKDGEFNDKHNLKELLKHTMLMYCITNDVSQSDLVKYIDSLKPEDIINVSNEQLGIS